MGEREGFGVGKQAPRSCQHRGSVLDSVGDGARCNQEFVIAMMILKIEEVEAFDEMIE